MPIPTAPTLLLAVGGMLLIVSRWVRASRSFELVWLASIAGTLWLLATSDVQIPGHISAVAYHANWAADPLGIAGQSLALVIGILFGIGSFGLRSTSDRSGERFGFLSFQTAGLMLVAAANDAVTMALSVEVVQFAALALRKNDREKRIREQQDYPLNNAVNSHGDASLWTFGIASMFLWLGIALLSHVTASTNYDEIRLVLTDLYQPGANRAPIGSGSKLGLLGIGFMVAGLGTRIGLVPWQIALNQSSHGVGYWTQGCVLLSSQLAGILALCRLCGTVWIGYRDELIVLLTVLAGLTFLVAGSLSALGLMPGEGRIQRWLISLPMLSAAWLTIGLTASVTDLAAPEQSLAAAGGQPGALALTLFAAGANLVGLSGLFLLFSYLSRENREVEFVDELLGLGQLAPASATALMIILVSLVGQPPLWGFWGNWLLMVAGFNVRAAGGRGDVTPHLGLVLLLIVAAFATLLTAGIAIRFARIIILEPPISRMQPQGRRATLVAGCICSLILIVVGVAPARLLSTLSSVRGLGTNSVPDVPSGLRRGQSTANK